MWAESQSKCVNINLPSEQGESDSPSTPWVPLVVELSMLCCLSPHSIAAFEAFKLLVELSYGYDYTLNPSDSTPLPVATLLGLIVVADMFQFNLCIRACCKHLMRQVGADTGLEVIEGLRHLSHPNVESLLDTAIFNLGRLEHLWKQEKLSPSLDDSQLEILKVGIFRTSYKPAKNTSF